MTSYCSPRSICGDNVPLHIIPQIYICSGATQSVPISETLYAQLQVSLGAFSYSRSHLSVFWGMIYTDQNAQKCIPMGGRRLVDLCPPISSQLYQTERKFRNWVRYYWPDQRWADPTSHLDYMDLFFSQGFIQDGIDVTNVTSIRYDLTQQGIDPGFPAGTEWTPAVWKGPQLGRSLCNSRSWDVEDSLLRNVQVHSFTCSVQK